MLILHVLLSLTYRPPFRLLNHQSNNIHLPIPLDPSTNTPSYP